MLRAQTSRHPGIRLARLGVFRRFPVGQKQSTDDRPALLVSCSNLIPLKRVSLIINALARLRFPFRWVHFGTGPLQDKLENEAKCELPPGTYTFKGYTENAHIHRFYAEHSPDLFLSASETEGLPVAMMEAMAYSIPVAATGVGGVPEIVQHEENGFLLPENTTGERLAEAIGAYCALNRQRKMLFREKAWATFAAHFNAEKNFERFAEDIGRL